MEKKKSCEKSHLTGSPAMDGCRKVAGAASQSTHPVRGIEASSLTKMGEDYWGAAINVIYFPFVRV